MHINYNVSGIQRKALAEAISQILNYPKKYLRAPTYSFSVGHYNIDFNGVVSGPDNLDLEDELHQRGFDAVERVYDEPDTYESGLGGLGATPSPEELEAEIYAQREMRRLQIEDAHIPDYSNRGPYGGDYEINICIPDEAETDMERDCLNVFQTTVEVPVDGFTPEKLDNLFKMVNAKAALLKTALDVDKLPIQQTSDTLSFPWFYGTPDGDFIKAYTTLIEKICASAKEKVRVNAREREYENPRFAMRCWLLSLGFIGAEYKKARKILLSKLPGKG